MKIYCERHIIQPIYFHYSELLVHGERNVFRLFGEGLCKSVPQKPATEDFLNDFQ